MFDIKLAGALTLYITSIFMSNLLGMKTMPFLFGTHLSFAVFTLPFIFITTDIIVKVYSKEVAKKFVLLGFFALSVWTLFTLFASVVPWSENSYSRIGTAYDTIFTLSIRVALASLTAFIIAEYLDVLVFARLKTQKSSFFLASSLSNIVSQFLDTAIFMSIAFLGVFSFETIVLMALPWWIYKVSIGFLYMPFSYIILHYFSKNEQKI